MASQIIVEVSKIKSIKSHSNADKLEIANIKGWNCIIPKDKYKKGDVVLFIPPDAILPQNLIDEYGVGNYLKGKGKNRVGATRLRGEMSAGLIVDVPNPNWKIGKNVAEELNITKYDPPVRTKMGNAEKEDPFFFKYTDIENLRNYDNVFIPGETVVVTEKIDGSNCKFKCTNKTGLLSKIWPSKFGFKWSCGSHNVNRKKPKTFSRIKENVYWYPYTQPNIREMLSYCLKTKQGKHIIIYGELYGAIRGGVKSMNYNRPSEICYAAFDISIDGKYLDYSNFVSLCQKFDIPMVSLIAIMPFDLDKILALANGPSALITNGKPHIREGIVVRPEVERTQNNVGRVIMKVHGDDYLDMKDKKEQKGEIVDVKDE